MFKIQDNQQSWDYKNLDKNLENHNLKRLLVIKFLIYL